MSIPSGCTDSEIKAHIEDLNLAVRRSLLDKDMLRQTAVLAAQQIFKLICNFPVDLQPLILKHLALEGDLQRLVDVREAQRENAHIEHDAQKAS